LEQTKRIFQEEVGMWEKERIEKIHLSFAERQDKGLLGKDDVQNYIKVQAIRKITKEAICKKFLAKKYFERRKYYEVNKED
jgi:stalled ribosome rescue protein Dom34